MPEPTDPKKLTTTLRLPAEWHEALRDRAHQERRSIADLIREAIRERFGFKDPPPSCC
jgi:predicted DNA-binding protein